MTDETPMYLRHHKKAKPTDQPSTAALLLSRALETVDGYEGMTVLPYSLPELKAAILAIEAEARADTARPEHTHQGVVPPYRCPQCPPDTARPVEPPDQPSTAAGRLLVSDYRITNRHGELLTPRQRGEIASDIEAEARVQWEQEHLAVQGQHIDIALREERKTTAPLLAERDTLLAQNEALRAWLERHQDHPLFFLGPDDGDSAVGLSGHGPEIVCEQDDDHFDPTALYALAQSSDISALDRQSHEFVERICKGCDGFGVTYAGKHMPHTVCVICGKERTDWPRFRHGAPTRTNSDTSDGTT